MISYLLVGKILKMIIPRISSIRGSKKQKDSLLGEQLAEESELLEIHVPFAPLTPFSGTQRPHRTWDNTGIGIIQTSTTGQLSKSSRIHADVRTVLTAVKSQVSKQCLLSYRNATIN